MKYLILWAVLLAAVAAQSCVNTPITCADTRTMTCGCTGQSDTAPMNFGSSIQTAIANCENGLNITDACQISFTNFFDFIAPLYWNVSLPLWYDFPITADLTTIVQSSCIPLNITQFYKPRQSDLANLFGPDFWAFIKSYDSGLHAHIYTWYNLPPPVWDSYTTITGGLSSYCQIDGITCLQDIAAPSYIYAVDTYTHYPCTVSTPWGIPWLDMRNTDIDMCNPYTHKNLRNNEPVTLWLPVYNNTRDSPYYSLNPDWSAVLNMPFLKQIVLFSNPSYIEEYPPPQLSRRSVSNKRAHAFIYPTTPETEVIANSTVERITFYNVDLNIDKIDEMLSGKPFTWLDFWFSHSGNEEINFSDIAGWVTNSTTTVEVLSVFNLYDVASYTHTPPSDIAPTDFIMSLPSTLKHFFFTDEGNTFGISLIHPYTNLTPLSSLESFYVANVTISHYSQQLLCQFMPNLRRFVSKQTSSGVANTGDLWVMFNNCTNFEVLDVSHSSFVTFRSTFPTMTFAKGAIVDLSFTGIEGNINTLSFNGPPTRVSFDGLGFIHGQMDDDLCAPGVILSMFFVPACGDSTICVCYSSSLSLLPNSPCKDLIPCS